MGISSALYSGVSGLNTNGQAMTVIGNNLANTNTLGFKSSRTIFADLLSSSINGSGGISQVGRGVGLSKVDQIFSQGTFESTESNLDVAIEGDGFFILKESGNATAYYSRAGSFRFDQDGFLINPEGLRVQGKVFDANGLLAAGDATDIQVQSSGLIQGTVTSTLQLTTNLDSTEPVITQPFDYANPDTYNYSSSVQVFDTLGNPQLLSTYFTKTGDNTWKASWSAEQDNNSGYIMSGTFADPLVFTPDGVLTNEAAVPPTATTAIIPTADITNLPVASVISLPEGGKTNLPVGSEIDLGTGPETLSGPVVSLPATVTAITLPAISDLTTLPAGTYTLPAGSTLRGGTTAVTATPFTLPGDLSADPLSTDPLKFPNTLPEGTTAVWTDYTVTNTLPAGSTITLSDGTEITLYSETVTLPVGTEITLPSGSTTTLPDGTEVVDDPLNPTLLEGGALTTLADGSATFLPAASLNWGNGTTPTDIVITFDTTQFNSESVVISQNQNGSGAGNLTGIAIDPEGRVIASYSNGEQTKVSQLVLGKFVNTGGLALAGSNLYTATTTSGAARTGLPGPELGNIFTNSLEQSNVDMGAEFVRMITVQRGFQANSKIITTVDELLGELINLKR
jgi:flagellar hook protein FlgE